MCGRGAGDAGERGCGGMRRGRRCDPTPRTNRTRRVPPPVLIGHTASASTRHGAHTAGEGAGLPDLSSPPIWIGAPSTLLVTTYQGDAARPFSTGRGTRRVRFVRGGDDKRGRARGLRVARLDDKRARPARHHRGAALERHVERLAALALHKRRWRHGRNLVRSEGRGASV